MFERFKKLLGRSAAQASELDPGRLWRDTMERSNEALLIIRPPRQILFANAAAASLLERPADSLIDSSFGWPLTLGRLSSISIPRGQGEPARLEAGAAAIRWNNAAAWLVTLRNVTEPQRLLSLKGERVKVLERMAEGAALSDILTALIQFVELQHPQAICTVMLLDADERRLRYGASTRLPRDMIDLADLTLVAPNHGSCGCAAFERRAVIVKDIASDPRWVHARDVALASGIHACWSTPIFSTAGAVVGTFATYYASSREPATEEIELVTGLAPIAGVAIERHRVERQLKLLQSGIAHLNDLLVITEASPLDAPGPAIVFVNEAVTRLTGWSRAELMGKSPRLFQGPATDRLELDRIREALQARRPVRAELINYTREGKPFWVELDITPIQDASDRTTHFVSVQRNISDFKEVEAAMRQSEERFRLVARVTTDAIWDWNLQTSALWWSEGIEKLFGHAVAELAADVGSWTSRLHPDDRDRVVDGVHALIDSGGSDWQDAYRFRRGDGSYAHVVDRGTVIRNHSGKPVRMIGGLNDVTERHLAEADARRAAQAQSIIVRAQREIAESILDVHGVMQLIAQRAQELAGAEGAAVLVAEDDALVYRAVSGSAHPHLGLRLDSEHSIAGTAIRLREAQICADAEQDPRTDRRAYPLVLARSVMCVPLHQKELWGAMLSVITGRPNAFDSRDLANLEILADSLGAALQRAQDAEQLQRSESKYRQLFDGNPHPVLVYDPETLRFVAVNAAAVAVYGYTEAEFLRMSVLQLHPQEQLARLQQQLAKSPRAPCNGDRWRHRHNGGTLIDVELSSDDIEFEGAPARLVLVTDITARMATERELARISRASLMLRRCNAALLRATSEQGLLEAVCGIGVETGGYRLSWVGLAMNDASRTILPVASAGEGAAYLDGLSLSWATDSPQGLGPSGQVVRENHAVVVEDVRADPDFGPWAERAQEHGLRAAISLPLSDRAGVFGHLSFYASTVLAMHPDELALLKELADNLAYGISNLRAMRERERLQQAVARVAVLVAADGDDTVLQSLVESLAQAIGADACFMLTLPESQPERAVCIAGVVDGQRCAALDWDFSDSVYAHAAGEDVRIVADRLDRHFPRALPCPGAPMRAYVGQRLTSVGGAPAGVLCVLFREPFRDSDAIVSALGIFAIRAAAELARQAADRQIQDQASLLNQTRESIVAGDLDHHVTFWNRGAERLYGWRADEILGVGKIDQVYPDPGVVKIMFAQLPRDGEWSGQLEQRRKDGRIIRVDARSTLIRDEHGVARFFLVVASETTAARDGETPAQARASGERAVRRIQR